MAENLEIEGRYSVRAPMQWSGEPPRRLLDGRRRAALCRPVVAAEGWGPERVNVAAQRREPGSLLNWMERLIRRRRECPELGWGRCTLLDAGHAAVLCPPRRLGRQHGARAALVRGRAARGARRSSSDEVEEAVDLFDGERR